MIALFHRHFDKQYAKLPKSVQRRFEERLAVFVRAPFDPLLNNHALLGRFVGYRSIGITGNIRAIYKSLDEDTVEFALIGTHHELYGR